MLDTSYRDEEGLPCPRYFRVVIRHVGSGRLLAMSLRRWDAAAGKYVPDGEDFAEAHA